MIYKTYDAVSTRAILIFFDDDDDDDHDDDLLFPHGSAQTIPSSNSQDDFPFLKLGCCSHTS